MRRVLSVLLCFSFLLTISGCTEQEIPAVSLENNSQIMLDVVTSYGGDDGNHSNYIRAVEEFEKNSNVRIQDHSSLSSEKWKSDILTDFMTGSEPDVLFYFVGADAAPFVNADKVVSVEEIRTSYPGYGTNMKQSALKPAADGQHYAVPSTGYWESLYVNKAVLQKAGVSIPGPDYTWSQFLKDCEVIKKAGFTPIACSLFEIPHYWFEFMVLNEGNLQNHLNMPRLDEEGELVMDSVARKWISGLEEMKHLYDLGYFPDNTLTGTDAQTVSMFCEGQAAFMIEGSWKMGFLAENYPDNLEDYVVSFVPGRGERKASDTIGGISMGYFITRKAWDSPLKREAAVQFVSHMTSQEVLSSFVTVEVTALEEGVHPTGLNTVQRSAANAAGYVTGYVSAVQDQLSSESKKDLFSNIPRVITGQMTAAQAVESALRLN